MRREMTGRRRAAVIALVVSGLLSVTACDITENLLEASDPDLIRPEDVNNAEGALAVANGTLEFFREITGGSESTWLFGGLLADEWSTSSTFVENDETDQRRVKVNNGSVEGMYRDLHRTRIAADLAIRSLREFRPDPPRLIAEMYLARGFAEMQLGQDFCNGIPLGHWEGDEVVSGDPLPVDSLFRRAIASYDSAIALATAPDSVAVVVRRAALIGKARALLSINDTTNGPINQAAALFNAPDTIPLAFAYTHTFAVTSGDNILWSQPASQRRYTVGDSLEGNGRDFFVRNAIGFFSARDPRLPVSYTVAPNGRDTTKSQDGQTNSRTTTLWARTSAVPVLNGIDVRMVLAEQRLRAGDFPGMMGILNGLRAAPPRLVEVQPVAMAPLPVPTDMATAVNVFFREKAFWTFSRGQRLGDLRRLIRQYGRTADNTFPSGDHYKANTYGPDVNLPVPQAEQNNDRFTQCLDRRA